MSCYTHLTIIEREKILYFLGKGYSITKIANELHRSKSTISREIKRNSCDNEYLPSIAQLKYQSNRSKCCRKSKLSDFSLFEKVKYLFLEQQWSPEQISARMKLEQTYSISFNTIYRGIYSGKFDAPGLSHGNRGAIRKLRHKGKSRHTCDYEERRGKIRISNHIKDRPKSAEKRSVKGHWEADTVAGKTGFSCLVTLVDRKTRYLIGGKVLKKRSDYVSKAMIELLKGQPLRSITPDRGKEFAMHGYVTDNLDGVKFYFPLPHHPWQRGSNENTNGLLREYFPKGKDISDITEEYIQSKIDKLNNRPRKCLGYKTPFEAYFSKSLHLT